MYKTLSAIISKKLSAKVNLKKEFETLRIFKSKNVTTEKVIVK